MQAVPQVHRAAARDGVDQARHVGLRHRRRRQGGALVVGQGLLARRVGQHTAPADQPATQLADGGGEAVPG